MSSCETQTAANRFRFLAEAVAWRYRPQGFAVRWQAYQRLMRDPFYRQLLAGNRLPTAGTILDLGCGRGIFLALLVSAQALGMAGSGKRPEHIRLVGVESHPKLAESARMALADKAEIIAENLLSATLPRCHTAVLQDVLLCLEPDEQDQILQRLATGLETGGTIILREPDAGALFKRVGIRLATAGVGVLRGQETKRVYPRCREEWTQRLEALGLNVESLPTENTAGFASVLLLAKKPSAESANAC